MRRIHALSIATIAAAIGWITWTRGGPAGAPAGGPDAPALAPTELRGEVAGAEGARSSSAALAGAARRSREVVAERRAALAREVAAARRELVGGDHASEVQHGAAAGEGDRPSVPEGEEPEPPDTVWKPDPGGIRGAVRERIGEIRRCYEAWVELDPAIEGKLAVRFAITAELLDGAVDPAARAKVTDVDIVGSTLDHTLVEGCVRSVFSELRFEPPPSGRLDVTYPLRFASGDAGP